MGKCKTGNGSCGETKMVWRLVLGGQGGSKMGGAGRGPQSVSKRLKM